MPQIPFGLGGRRRQRWRRPLEVGAKEPVNVPHEFNCDHSCEKLLKLVLDLRVFQELNEVVNVDAKGERSRGRSSCWVGWVDYVACEETWVRGVVLEAKAVEYSLDLGVPVPGASTEAVQGTFEEPILILLGIRIADWRFDDRDFIVGEDALAEGILTVALLKCTPSFDRHADHLLHCVRTEDWSILFGLYPDAVLVVTKYNDG